MRSSPVRSIKPLDGELASVQKARMTAVVDEIERAFAPAGDEGAPGGMAPAPAFASLTIPRSVDAARHVWAALVPHALATPYQQPALLGAWIDHVAPSEGVEPFVVVASDAAGEPVALLPFCAHRRVGLRIAGFMGGSHVNYNVPVIRHDRLALFTAQEAARLLAEAAALGGIDVFVLRNQPEVWEGSANPFAGLPRQPSPDPAFSGPLAPSLEEHLKLFVSAKSRSNQRRKMRRFEERGTPRIYRAESPAERARLLDAYFAQKADQFAERGIANVFEKPGVRDFISAASGLDGATPVIDLYGFDLDGETIAVTGGLADAERYCGMFISITSGEHAKYSPGEMLMNFVVEDSIRRGLRTFDLGVGAATYKKMYCPNPEPLFDSIVGATLLGRAAATAFAAKTALKAKVKASPRLYALLDRVRQARARGAAAPESPETD